MNTAEKSRLLNEIACIQRMEKGTLSPYQFKDRPAPAQPHYKLQCWENGKNCTRHVPAAQVPAVQEALAGHQKFTELVRAYETIVITETRADLLNGDKKKARPRPPSSSPRTPNSRN